MDWYGRAREYEEKLRGLRVILTMDWRGRTLEREIKLYIFLFFSNMSAPRTTLPMDWRGRTLECVVKSQLVGVTRNPSHGLAWSNVGTRGKVTYFFLNVGVTRNLPQGLTWSNIGTRGKVGYFFIFSNMSV